MSNDPSISSNTVQPQSNAAIDAVTTKKDNDQADTLMIIALALIGAMIAGQSLANVQSQMQQDLVNQGSQLMQLSAGLNIHTISGNVVTEANAGKNVMGTITAANEQNQQVTAQQTYYQGLMQQSNQGAQVTASNLNATTSAANQSYEQATSVYSSFVANTHAIMGR